VIISSPKNKEEISWISINLKQDFPMRMLAENFLSPSFGGTVVSVRIVDLKELIPFQEKPPELAYTSAAGVKGNLR
jgi:hypothetical protein